MAYLGKWMRRCLFICIFAVFFMSHNVSALNNQLLGDDWVLYRHTAGNPMCAQNSTAPEARRQSVSSPWNLNNGEFSYWSCADSNNSPISAKQGDIIVVELNTDYELSPYWYNTSARYLFTSYSRNIQTIYYYTDGFNHSVEFGWTYNSEINGANNTLFRIQSINFYRKSGGAPSYEGALNTINNSINNLNNSVNGVKDAIDNQNKEEKQETQDASDDAAEEISGDSENAATSNLIGIISNFISSISDFTGGNCNLSLAFPSYAGGTLNVNVCQNKDKAGNIIEVFTSLTLIVFYLPLALKLLSMIYNEIRSFTNG